MNTTTATAQKVRDTARRVGLIVEAATLDTGGEHDFYIHSVTPAGEIRRYRMSVYVHVHPLTGRRSTEIRTESNRKITAAEAIGIMETHLKRRTQPAVKPGTPAGQIRPGTVLRVASSITGRLEVSTVSHRGDEVTLTDWRGQFIKVPADQPMEVMGTFTP